MRKSLKVYVLRLSIFKCPSVLFHENISVQKQPQICPLDIQHFGKSQMLVLKMIKYLMNLVMRKPAFCICENKDADQLRGNGEADQRLCLRFIKSTIPLLPIYEI